jgi:DNA-directed RNA polymerase subunit N (RpoN/RPB10)
VILNHIDAAEAETIQDALGEMKAGSWCCNRATLASVDGLVTWLD